MLCCFGSCGRSVPAKDSRAEGVKDETVLLRRFSLVLPVGSKVRACGQSSGYQTSTMYSYMIYVGLEVPSIWVLLGLISRPKYVMYGYVDSLGNALRVASWYGGMRTLGNHISHSSSYKSKKIKKVAFLGCYYIRNLN